LGLLLLQCPLAVNLLCLFSRAVELGIVAEDGIDGGADEGVVRRGDDGVYLEVVGIGNEVGGRLCFFGLAAAAGGDEKEEEKGPHPDPQQ